MKDDRRTPEEQALDQLVRESKDALVPAEPDWTKLEARLMAAVAKEPRPVVDDVRTSATRSNVIRIGAAVLAAAAAVALFVGNDHESALDHAPVSASDGVAGSVRATEGAGEVRVSGLTAAAGQVLRAGDVLEADGARALLERPRKVSWLLEKEEANGAKGFAKVKVKSAAEALVLGLEDGAVEAQVVPVPSGEAFAIDVASEDKVVRVAVHGTHLRVARTGSRVVVDLSEGVVSIGAPPRFGSTYGTLVTAPAHVELDVRDLEGSLKIDHTTSAVRVPVPLGGHDPIAIAPKETTPAPKPNGAKPEVMVANAPPRAGHPPDTTNAPATTATPAAPRPALSPRETIAQAVKDCAAQKKSSPSDVRVTLASSLKLQIGPSGDVERAVFDPPLMPEIQSCAAIVIYKTKLEGESGPVTVPIELSY